MDRLLSMRAFQQVVEQGSFAAAARTMDISPAVITRLVADLEQSLGTRLLHRTTRKLSLTAAGNEYGARLHQILQDIEEAETAASAHAKELHGTIRLISSPTLASFFLAPCLALWYQRHPGLLLDITVDPLPLSRLEAFDLALIAADEHFDANVVARPLSKRPMVLCAAPAYLHRKGYADSPQALQNYDYLRPHYLPGQDPSGRNLRLEPTDGGGAEHAVEIPVRTLLRGQFDILLRAGLDGLGFLAASELVARPYIERGELEPVLPEWSLGPVTVYGAVSSRKFMPAKTRAALDFLVDIATTPPVKHASPMT